jgi:group I intron endonuclease
MIINLQNNKIYIGSAVKFVKRRCQHLSYLRNNIHHSLRLQRSFNKYGEENFVFKVINYYKEISYDDLLLKEEYYIHWLKPEFNTAWYVTKPALGSKRTQEAIDKQKLAMVGRVRSQAHKDNISKAKKGIKLGIHRTEESKQYMRLLKSKYAKPVNQYDLEGNFIKQYPSTKEARRQTGINHGSISSCCNPLEKEHNTSGGYIWRWANKQAIE